MRANNTIVPQEQEKQKSFSQAITGEALQNLIKKSVPDARSAARFTGTLISVVSQNPALQKVVPATIVACALRGEGAGLQIGRDYHVVPFGSTATYIIGYKGMLSLLMATGEVDDANCIPVYEGELIGRNKRTKRQEFDFSVYATEEEERQHPVIGYYFYVAMLNGSFRYEYMSVSKILDHAERFSKTFNRDDYNKMVNGEITGDELEKLKAKSPWYGNTEAMMKKTVIRSLLNSGYVRIANDAMLQQAMQDDAVSEEGIIPDVVIDTPAIEVDESTGEVVSMPENQPQEAPQPAPAPAPAPTQRTSTRRNSAPARTANPVDNDFFGEEAPMEGFFNE